MNRNTPSFQFPPLTQFVRTVLLGLTGLFMVELIAMSWIHLPLQHWMTWAPQQTFTEPWTIILNYFFFGSNPMGFLFEMIALYFFIPPILQSYPMKKFHQLLQFTLVIATVLGILGIAIGAVTPMSGPAYGLRPFITAMICVFGLSNPHATIYLLVFPVQAAWVAWGSGILALLTFLSGRELDSLLLIGGWIAGYIFVHQRRLRKQLKSNRRKSTRNDWKVVQGGKYNEH